MSTKETLSMNLLKLWLENMKTRMQIKNDLSQDKFPLVVEQDVIVNRFAIKNNNDLEDILDALETYCFN